MTLSWPEEDQDESLSVPTATPSGESEGCGIRPQDERALSKAVRGGLHWMVLPDPLPPVRRLG